MKSFQIKSFYRQSVNLLSTRGLAEVHLASVALTMLCCGINGWEKRQDTGLSWRICSIWKWMAKSSFAVQLSLFNVSLYQQYFRPCREHLIKFFNNLYLVWVNTFIPGQTLSTFCSNLFSIVERCWSQEWPNAVNLFRCRQDQSKCWTHVEQTFEHVQISFNIV